MASLSAGEIRRRKKRGYDAERELVRMLREKGYSAVRIPASAPSNKPLPDAFATKNDLIIAFEVKSPKKGKAYYRRDQVEKLFKFLDMFKPFKKRMVVLAAKFPYKWVFKHLQEPGDYSISRKDESNIIL